MKKSKHIKYKSMALQLIYLLDEDVMITDLNGSAISPALSVDNFLAANSSWGLAYSATGNAFLFVNAGSAQTIKIAGYNGGADMEFRSAPFVGGRPSTRPWKPA